MNAAVIERRLRRFLLIVVALSCIATFIELILEKHTKELLQFVPFALCVAGFLSVVAVLARPQPLTINILRAVMALVILGSLLGGWEHLESNVDFETEMRPGITAIDAIPAALMGAAPLLAPGILGLAGVLALAATYYHPALGKRSDG